MVEYNVDDFDVNDLFAYKGIVDSISGCEYFKEEELGEPTNLIWDYDFLMTTMKIILEKNNHKLQRLNGFSTFWMVCDFINEATIYSLVNNRNIVGKKEIINTFKNWEYLPIDLRLDVLDDLFIQENIDYQFHPFGLSHPRKKIAHQKIIRFEDYYN